jgi:hypothetical protein
MPGVKGRSGGSRKGAGRKAFEPTEEQRKLVSQLVAVGVRQEDLPIFFDVCLNTIRLHFAEEIANAKLKANAAIARKLYNEAVDGNITAMIFWLKTQAGWSERNTLDLNVNPKKLDDMTDEQLAAIAAGSGAALARAQKGAAKPA